MGNVVPKEMSMTWGPPLRGKSWNLCFAASNLPVHICIERSVWFWSLNETSLNHMGAYRLLPPLCSVLSLLPCNTYKFYAPQQSESECDIICCHPISFNSFSLHLLLTRHFICLLLRSSYTVILYYPCVGCTSPLSPPYFLFKNTQSSALFLVLMLFQVPYFRFCECINWSFILILDFFVSCLNSLCSYTFVSWDGLTQLVSSKWNTNSIAFSFSP